MFFYYYCGNLILGVTLTYILYIVVDRPFFSLFKISSDKKIALLSRNVDIYEKGFEPPSVKIANDPLFNLSEISDRAAGL
jgi:hypothetical protein